MIERLDHHGSNIYSQFGEDGVIAHVFDRIGAQHSVAVEFGAGDGLSCSNTAHLWKDLGWHGFLVEPDDERFDDLTRNTADHNTTCVQSFVTPTGPTSIAELLAARGVTDVDFMSIDIDGNDYRILEHLACRPRVITIEFNPTVPPHVDIRQQGESECFGASLLALTRLAERLGYGFIGATYCNAFLVNKDEAAAFAGYETRLPVLFPPEQYSYAVTDQIGRAVLVGNPLPWEAKEPFVLPLITEETLMPPTNSVAELRRGFQSEWGSCNSYTTRDFAATTPELWASHLRYVLSGRPNLVFLDMTGESTNTIEFYIACAETLDYRAVRVGDVVGLINNQEESL